MLSEHSGLRHDKARGSKMKGPARRNPLWPPRSGPPRPIRSLQAHQQEETPAAHAGGV